MWRSFYSTPLPFPFPPFPLSPPHDSDHAVCGNQFWPRMGVSEFHSRIVRFGLNTSVPSQDLYKPDIPLLSPNQWCPSTKEGQAGPAPPPLSDGCKFPHVVPPSLPPPLSLSSLWEGVPETSNWWFSQADWLSGGQREVYIYTHTHEATWLSTRPACLAVLLLLLLIWWRRRWRWWCSGVQALKHLLSAGGWRRRVVFDWCGEVNCPLSVMRNVHRPGQASRSPHSPCSY